MIRTRLRSQCHSRSRSRFEHAHTIFIHPAKEPLPPSDSAAHAHAHAHTMVMHPAKEPLPLDSAADRELTLTLTLTPILFLQPETTATLATHPNYLCGPVD